MSIERSGTGKVATAYRDSAGHKCSLEWLVKNDPEWAVREVKRLLNENKLLREALTKARGES